jgi:hypothetical protein
MVPCSESIQTYPLNNMRHYVLRSLLTVLVAMVAAALPSTVYAQQEPRFVSGPLTWTPVFQLREAGIDSNVFNAASDPREDNVGIASSQLDSALTLGVLQASTQGSLDYQYFERYKSERGLNRRVSTHVEFPVTRFSPTATLSWAHVKERSGNEIDIRAPRTDWGYALGIQAKVTPRIAVTATGGKLSSRYERGLVFRGVELASQLDRETLLGSLSTRVTLTPLTSLMLDASVGRDRFPFRPDVATDNIRGTVGVEFAPDAVIRGKASIGYHSLQPHRRAVSDGSMAAFDGITSATELGYTLLGVTRFGGRFSRDSNYSISTTNSIYVSTAGGLDIFQRLVGPIDLNLRASREQLKYRETELASGHTDFADVVGGGLSITVGSGATVALLYENSQRRSTAGPQFEYTRRRLYTTVTYGF